MNHKNYYQVLGIKPSATTLDIKLSYRKLAFKYHPDKNQGDPIAEASFKEINEAYQVLSNNLQRQEYHRNYYRDHFSNYTSQNTFYQEIKLEKILSDALHLRKMVQAADPYRLNQDALVFQIEHILSREHLTKLAAENNTALNNQIAAALLTCLKPLKYNYLLHLIPSLKQLNSNDIETADTFNRFLQAKRKEAFWQKYQVLAAIALAIILCLAIYLVAH